MMLQMAHAAYTFHVATIMSLHLGLAWLQGLHQQLQHLSFQASDQCRASTTPWNRNEAVKEKLIWCLVNVHDSLHCTVLIPEKIKARKFQPTCWKNRPSVDSTSSKNRRSVIRAASFAGLCAIKLLGFDAAQLLVTATPCPATQQFGTGCSWKNVKTRRGRPLSQGPSVFPGIQPCLAIEEMTLNQGSEKKKKKQMTEGLTMMERWWEMLGKLGNCPCTPRLQPSYCL